MLSISPMNQQSFGMAYGFAPTKSVQTSKAIAKEMQTHYNPVHVEEFFTDKLVKPLQKLKTEVMADGEQVFVTHPVSGQRYEMLDSEPWAPLENYGRAVMYRVKKVAEDQVGGVEDVISVWHKEPQNNFGSLAWDATYLYNTPIMRKHIAALEVANQFDEELANKQALDAAKAASEDALEGTAKFLRDLVG